MIGVFDSGFGGMTVLKPIMDLMPEYDYIYLGDNARAPYGNHSAENITQFSEQAVNYLFDRGVRLIIFACNTASSTALRPIQKKLLNGDKETERKILGVLIPVAQEVAKLKNGSRVGIVGTRATIDSGAYEKEIHSINSSLKIYSKACPLLVPLIEENWHTKPEAHLILKKYLKRLKDSNVEGLVLACTHYPLMEKSFRRIMGNNVDIIMAGDITAKSLKDYLKRHPYIEEKITKNFKREYLTTDDPKNMQDFATKYLKINIPLPNKIKLT